MTDLKTKDGYYVDHQGRSALTPDGRPPQHGLEVQIGNRNGGHDRGYFDGSVFIKTHDPSTKSQT